ncbi:nitroreductase family protein [bacterium]|nr:nitroreductase family protein [bacterium]
MMSIEQLKSLIQSRRSIRKYQPRSVERKKIMDCLVAAQYAPSAQNVQPWRFVVLDSPETIMKVGATAFSGIYSPSRWALNAPVLVVLCAQLDLLVNRIGRSVQGTQYYLLDCGIAGEHFVMQAQVHGLGTCWIGWFHAKRLRKALNLPRSLRPVAVLSVGYPEKLPLIKRKIRPLAEMVTFWNSPK